MVPGNHVFEVPGDLNVNRLEDMSGRRLFSMKQSLISYWARGAVLGPGNTLLTKVSMGHLSCKPMVEETDRKAAVFSWL